MATALEQRLNFVERQTGDQAAMIGGLRDAVSRFELRCDRIEARIDRLETRMDRFEERIDQRFLSFDRKLDQRFGWLVGLQVTTLIATVAAVLSR